MNLLNLQDRAQGCLLGLAVGDAVGTAPVGTENLPADAGEQGWVVRRLGAPKGQADGNSQSADKDSACAFQRPVPFRSFRVLVRTQRTAFSGLGYH